jgi:hypothetical protein
MTDALLLDALVREIGKSDDLTLFRQYLPEGVQPEDVASLLAEPWHEEDDEQDVLRASARPVAAAV